MIRAAVLSPALSKEIRALLPLWGASVAALAAALMWRKGDLDLGLFAYVVGWFGFGIEPEAADNMILGRWTLGVIVFCPLAGLLGWRRFSRLEAIEAASPALDLPRWLRSAHGARLHAPLQALAVKEVHLQQLAFVVAGLYIVGWALSLLAQRYIPS